MSAGLSATTRSDSLYLTTPSAEHYPISRKAQWDLLRSHSEAACSAPNLSTPLWINDIEGPVLQTFLAMLRSELELIHSEKSRPILPWRKDSGIQMPDEHEGTVSPGHITTSQATTSALPRNENPQIPRRDLCIDVSAASTTNQASNGVRKAGQLSPLSPTFGPRKGLVPVGTVQRRKSRAYFDLPSSKDTTSRGISSKTGSCRSYEKCSTNGKAYGAPEQQYNTSAKRLLWEAAWLEIERNLENWTCRFSEERCQERDIVELWTELADMQAEKREALGNSACKVEDSGFDF